MIITYYCEKGKYLNFNLNLNVNDNEFLRRL